MSIKLMSINAMDGHLSRNLIRFIDKEDPDVINMQEVYSSGDIDSAYFNLKEELSKKLDYPYEFFSPVMEFKFSKYTARYGLLILSKHKMVVRKTVNIMRESNSITHLKDAGDINNMFNKNIIMQHARIRVGKMVLNDLNLHGYWRHSDKSGNSQTELECRRIRKYMDSLKGPIVLMGDFNLSKDSKSLEILSERYTNLVKKMGIKTTRNVLAGNMIPVDQTFINREVSVLSFKVPKVTVSDHLPLILNFK